MSDPQTTKRIFGKREKKTIGYFIEMVERRAHQKVMNQYKAMKELQEELDLYVR